MHFCNDVDSFKLDYYLLKALLTISVQSVKQPKGYKLFDENNKMAADG